MSSSAKRVEKHRRGLRAAGLRPVQIWVPDTRRPDFAAECRRQSKRVASADENDRELMGFLDDALNELVGGTD